MTNNNQKNHAFIYDRKFSRNAYRSCNAYDSNAMIASSSSFMHGRDMPKKILLIVGETLCLMLLGKCVMDLPLSFMLAMLNSFSHALMKR
jgi:hypothetical protein